MCRITIAVVIQLGMPPDLHMGCYPWCQVRLRGTRSEVTSGNWSWTQRPVSPYLYEPSVGSFVCLVCFFGVQDKSS